MAVNGLRITAETSGDLAEERLERLQDAQELLQTTQLIERSSYHMVSVDSLEGMQKSYSQVLSLMTQLDALVLRVSKAETDVAILSLHQAEQVFRNTAHVVARLRQSMLMPNVSSDYGGILLRYQGQMEQQVAAMTTAAEEVSTRLTNAYREKIRQLAAKSRQDQRLGLTMIAGSLLLAWLLYRFFMDRHVVARLQLVSRYLRAGGSDNRAIRVPVGGHDEIANMARAVEQFLEDHRQLIATKLSLQQSEEMLRAVTDAVQSGVFLIDDGDCIQFVNPAATHIFGYDREELIGSHLHELFVPERLCQQAQEGLSRYWATGEGPVLLKPLELQARHKDGRELTLLIHVGSILKNGRRWAVGSVIDISERLAAEADLKKAQNEAMNAARMAAIGTLAAGVAHEINTPAQYINDNLRFIEDGVHAVVSTLSLAMDAVRKTADSEIMDSIEETYETADIDFLEEELPLAVQQALDGMGKVSQIVQSMKEFSHPGGGTNEIVDINKCIENVVTVTRSMWKETATLEMRLDPGLPEIRCNLGEINQVLLNCIVNAVEAIEHLGQKELGLITIETQTIGEEVLVLVTDTGGGIAAEIREHIFEPFFTTKPVGKGIGQGLAICYDIVVHKHGGRIEVGGTPGQGAVFSIYLPIRRS